MYRTYQPKRQKPRRSKKALFLLSIISIAVVAIVVFWFASGTSEAPEPVKKQTDTKAATKPKEPEKPTKVDLQPTIDAWVAGQSGNYGIVVYDPANEAVIASYQPDEQFFTASIYKLYVAYLALQDIEAGKLSADQVILAGQTRKQCIYKMIHSSDSPCGETVLNSMGASTVTERLKSQFGFTNTAFPAFVTSAQDALTITKRLQAKQDLDEEHTAFLLDAMKTQIYRNGVPTGAPEATVYDKIGFDSPDLWTDVGIIELPGGRQYVYSIFGNGGVGSSQIADFARTIYPKLIESN